MASLDQAFNRIKVGPEPKERLSCETKGFASKNSRKYDQFPNHAKQTNLWADDCAVDCKANTARRPLKYAVTDFHSLGTNPIAISSPWVGAPDDGPGISRCAIDTDSHLRNDSKLTNINLRQPLPCFPIQSPFLGRGCHDPDVEMALRGKDTYADKSCLPKSSNFHPDRSFQIFDHLGYDPQREKHVVFPYNQSGLGTRHIFMETYRNGENCKQNRNFPPMRNCDQKESHVYSAGRYDTRGNKMWNKN